MGDLSEPIRAVKDRLARLVNEAIKYKFGVNGRDRRIYPADLVIDPSAGVQTYYFRDEAVYNKGPWKDFVDYNANGRLPLNTTAQKLFRDVDKAIINGDIIVKLVDTPGQLIDWDDLRGWHYHSPSDNFNDEFNHTIPWKSDHEDVGIRYYVYIHGSRGNDCEGDDDKDGDGDQGGEEDNGDNKDEDYKPSV